MKHLLFMTYSLLALGFGMLLCGCGAFGIGDLIWGENVTDAVRGSPPDRGHPAFWLVFVLLVPGMLLGASGAFFLLILPVALRFPEAASLRQPKDLLLGRPLKDYAERIVEFITRQEERFESSRGGEM